MPGFDPDQPRDKNGQWTDGGAAIRSAASDGPTQGIAFAPYRSKAVNTEQEDENIRASIDYKIHQDTLREAATGLNIQIVDKMDTWGGYIDSETGVPVQEVSNMIHVNTTPEKAEVLAAILGKAAPEQQDSVLVGNHDPNGDGIEYTIRTGGFKNAQKAISSMKDAGISYYTINKNNGDIVLLDTDNSIPDNVTNFVADLKKRGLYEGAEFSRTKANFVTSNDYDRIIEKARLQARSENGFNIDAFIKETKAKYAAKRKIAAMGVASDQ